MSAYYLTIFAVLVFSFLAVIDDRFEKENTLKKKSLAQKVWLLLVVLILICVSGLRYYVGTDYGGYYTLESSWKIVGEKFISLDEPGFYFIAEILKWISNDGAVFIFITSAFIMGAIMFITYKYTDAYLFATLLIVFTGVWHGSFNGVRQYFAAAIICLGHRYVFDKKFWKYLICVLFASLFHISAIVMIVPYFILRNKISIFNILIMLVGALILLFNYELIFSFIGSLKDKTLDTTDAYMSNSVNILRVVVNICPAIFCLIMYWGKEKDKEQTFYLNILILYALLSIVGMNSPYITRINIYLGVLVPLAMGKLIVFKDKTIEIMFKILIVVLFFVFWYYEISISTALNDFKWIWER